MSEPFNKPPLSSEDHLSLLQDRGMTISDKERALKYLETIGYYRLSGYMYHLQKRDMSHEFLSETSFNDVILHYQFDKRLRSLFLDYIERIEVALRAKLTNKYSLSYGFSWYREGSLYSDPNVYIGVNRKINGSFSKSQEQFLKSFRRKYSDDHPPSNMAMEILSLGNLSKLYDGLKNSDQKKEIADDFGLPVTILTSWMSSLTITRNICANHSRLWNITNSVNQPRISGRKDYQFKGELPRFFSSSTYCRIAVIERLLREINSTNSFIQNFEKLLSDFPIIDEMQMGFPDNWKNEPAWMH